MVHEFGGLHKALIVSCVAGLLACGGSALEGSGPDGAGDVDGDGVAEVSETEVETTSEVADGETSPETLPDAVDSLDGVDATETEVDVGPVDWEPLSLGDGGVIGDLVLVSSKLGFAASGTRVLRWDGRLWATFGEPGGTTGLVHGVWADDTVVVAVGAGGLASARPIAGGRWQPLAGAPAVTLRAAAGRAADDVFVAGDDGTVAHWNGTAWATKFTSATIDLNAIWLRPGSSGDEGVFAVGTGGQLVTLVNGAWKAAQIAKGSVDLEDVIGLGDGTMLAVGDEHTITIKRPQAAAWQGQISNDERERDLTALATQGGLVRIFGASGAVLLASGPSWNVDTTANGVVGVKDFAVADAVAGGVMMALARGGGGVRLDDAAWSTVATAPEAMLTAFAQRGDELWAVGTKGFLARRDAQGWSVVPSGTDKDLFGLSALSETALIAVGVQGTILRIETVDGEDVVSSIAAPVQVDLYGVAARAGEVVACGRGGTLLSIGDTVTLRASGTTADLKAVVLGGDDRLWVAGVFGTLLRLSTVGGAPEPIASGVGGALSGLAPSPAGVLAVGDNGVIVRATATEVVLEHESPGAFLYAVGVSSAGTAVAAGSGGLVLVRSGSSWASELPTERGATFDAVHVAPDGSEALLGGVFRLLHLESRRVSLEAP